MRRFVLVAMLGGVVTLVGHAVVTLGLHPERLSPAPVLLEGSAVIALGTALFITGMLGLAEAYEKVATRISALLEIKDLDQAGDLAVRDRDGLGTANRQFWHGYLRATGGIALFLGGVLGLAAGLSRLSVEFFTVGVGAGLVALASAAMTLAVRGLLRVRRAHVMVDRSANRLGRLPDRRPQVQAPRRRPRHGHRYDLFRRERLATEARKLARQRHPAGADRG